MPGELEFGEVPFLLGLLVGFGFLNLDSGLPLFLEHSFSLSYLVFFVFLFCYFLVEGVVSAHGFVCDGGSVL